MPIRRSPTFACLSLLLVWCTASHADTFTAPAAVVAAADGSFHYGWTYIVGDSSFELAGLGASNAGNTTGLTHGDCLCLSFCSPAAGDTIRWTVNGRLVNGTQPGFVRNWLAPCSGASTPAPMTKVLPYGTAGVNDVEVAAALRLWSSPNPFRTRTTIYYSLPEGGFAELAIFDAAGRRVATPLRQTEQAGPHSVIWEAPGADEAHAGVYFARLEFGGKIRTQRILLLE